MGDRANIFVIDRPKAAKDDHEVTGIYLYTHWNGSEWPEMLRQALSSANARRRWDDESYLTRILISQLYADDHDSDTGGGVSTMLTDNSHEIVIVDIPAQIVAFAPEGQETDRNNWTDSMSFADFCAQQTAKYPSQR
jgi:hypothetical protein